MRHLIPVRAAFAVLAILVVTLSACESLVDPVPRDNPNDPQSPDFHPDAPDVFFVTAQESGILIRWKDESDFEDGFLIEKSVASGLPYNRLALVEANATQFVDLTQEFTPETSYRLYVVASRNATENKSLVGVSRAILGHFLPLRGVSPSTAGLNVHWEDRIRLESGFLVEVRPQAEFHFTPVAELPPESPNYVDVGGHITFAHDLTYRITAFRDVGGRRYSIDEATIQAPVRQYTSPALFTARVLGEDRVEFSWRDRSFFEKDFVIDRSSDGGGSWTTIATPSYPHQDSASVERTYIHEEAFQNGTVYRYRLRARDAGGAFSIPQEVSATR